MRLSDILRPEHVIVPLQADSFRSAVRELVQRLVDTGALLHPERVEKLTTEDRVRDVVHVGDRILLPHLRTDAVDELVVAIGVSPLPLRTAGSTGESLAALARAADAGWSDVTWLRHDPAFDPVRDTPEVRRIGAAAAARVRLPPPVGSGGLG